MVFDDEYFGEISEFLIDFSKNTNKYILYILWGLLLLGVFIIFWAFFLRVNKNIKTGELISRLFISIVLFYFVWLVTNILNINLIVS